MLRSMYSAISGLKNHQTMMDVVGDNIANVNSTGFKANAVVFEDVLSQTLKGSARAFVAGAGTGTVNQGIGGTNPAQVGLGSRIAGTTTNFSQGSLQRTGRTTDVAIMGDGFFVVDQAGQRLYTRAGSLSVDGLGRVVTQEGGLIQGWQGDPNGLVNTGVPIGPVRIPVGDLVAPLATSQVTIGGSLSADSPVGTVLSSPVNGFDGQGATVPLTFSFTKTAADTWQASATYGNPPNAVALTNSTLTFDASGELSPANYSMDIAAGGIPGMGAVTVSLGAVGASGRIVQVGGKSSMAVLDQNGSAAGALLSFSFADDGSIVGTYSNGRSKTIGQVALANFNNPEGLEKAGGTSFRSTGNSGLPTVGTPGTGGRGNLTAGSLEMSNVDLAQEFTNLIVAQRGFQANSRVITAGDELLQDVVNLKR